MNISTATRKWSELYQLNVVDPVQGKVLGQVSDFFVQEGTNAIYALSVHTRLYGDLTLPVTGIKAIEGERLTVKNPQVLLRAIPPHLHGQSLISRKVVKGQKGEEIGLVKDVIVGIEPLVAMRVTGFEVANSNDRHKHLLSSDALAHYDDEHEALIFN